MKDFYDLFIYELRNMYNAEEKIIKSLPKLIESAKSEELKKAFRNHLSETKEQLKRLEEIGLEINEKLYGQECLIMTSLLKEIQKILHSKYEHDVRDAAFIHAAQCIEHYEIACYGTLKAYAKHFKLGHIEELLEANSKEEGEANKKLSELAEGTLFSSGINTKAHKKCA